MAEDVNGILEEQAALKAKVKAKTANAAEKLRLREIRLAILTRQLSAKRASIEDARRKAETRRKIILGAFVMNHLDKNETFRAYVARELPGFLSESDKVAVADVLEMLKI